MLRPLNFCYYLKGLEETLIEERPTVEQWDCVLRMFKQIEGSGEYDDPYKHTVMPCKFVNWLCGYIEISAVDAPNEREWKIIKDKLQFVFTKVEYKSCPKQDEGETKKDEIMPEITPEMVQEVVKDFQEKMSEEMKKRDYHCGGLIPPNRCPHCDPVYRYKLLGDSPKTVSAPMGSGIAFNTQELPGS